MKKVLPAKNSYKDVLKQDSSWENLHQKPNVWSYTECYKNAAAWSLEHRCKIKHQITWILASCSWRQPGRQTAAQRGYAENIVDWCRANVQQLSCCALNRTKRNQITKKASDTREHGAYSCWHQWQINTVQHRPESHDTGQLTAGCMLVWPQLTVQILTHEISAWHGGPVKQSNSMLHGGHISVPAISFHPMVHHASIWHTDRPHLLQ